MISHDFMQYRLTSLPSFPGSPTCEQKFREKGRAYDILSCEKHHSELNMGKQNRRLCIV